MMITRTNYESFLVDYADGTLPPTLIEELELFLASNPDIREEFDSYKEFFVKETNILFPAKTDLKGIPYSHMDNQSEIFHQKCVAYVEQLMPEEEIPVFLKSVKADAAKTKELDFFKKTILKPYTESFNEKLFLKQHPHLHNINDSNFDSYCVACMEGWLDQKGLMALNNYLQKHPDQKRILDLFYKTRLVPEGSVVFPYKNQLKHFTLLTNKTKKILTITSSAAAVLVFGTMLFYTSQIDTSKSTAATSIISGNMQPTEIVTVNPLSAENKEPLEAPNQTKTTLLDDPFGYQKVNITQSKLPEKHFATSGLSRVKPIEVSEIVCHPCKDMYSGNRQIQLAINTNNGEQEANIEDTVLPEDHGTRLIWTLAQAGVKGFSKITNTEFTISKEGQNEKTKIAFNSKYFAFSTQVESK